MGFSMYLRHLRAVLGFTAPRGLGAVFQLSLVDGAIGAAPELLRRVPAARGCHQLLVRVLQRDALGGRVSQGRLHGCWVCKGLGT